MHLALRRRPKQGTCICSQPQREAACGSFTTEHALHGMHKRRHGDCHGRQRVPGDGGHSRCIWRRQRLSQLVRSSGSVSGQHPQVHALAEARRAVDAHHCLDADVQDYLGGACMSGVSMIDSRGSSRDHFKGRLASYYATQGGSNISCNFVPVSCRTQHTSSPGQLVPGAAAAK